MWGDGIFLSTHGTQWPCSQACQKGASAKYNVGNTYTPQPLQITLAVLIKKIKSQAMKACKGRETLRALSVGHLWVGKMVGEVRKDEEVGENCFFSRHQFQEHTSIWGALPLLEEAANLPRWGSGDSKLFQALWYKRPDSLLLPLWRNKWAT